MSYAKFHKYDIVQFETFAGFFIGEVRSKGVWRSDLVPQDWVYTVRATQKYLSWELPDPITGVPVS